MTEETDERGFTAPTEYTRKTNQAVKDTLPLDDPQDFEDARRGLIASDPQLIVKREQDALAWNMPGYDFIEGDTPASVNPSLWR